MTPLIASVNPFFILGAILVVWALVLAGLGIAGRAFPGKLDKVIIVVSVVLAIATVASAAIGAATEDEGEGPHDEDGAAALPL